jgi:hypothetical protein
MFVVLTLVAVWLGRETNFVFQRRSFLHAVRAEKEIGFASGAKIAAEAEAHGVSYKRVEASRWRRRLGDEAIEEFFVPDRSPDRIETIRKLFPESMILEVIKESETGDLGLIYKPDRDRGDLIGETQTR